MLSLLELFDESYLRTVLHPDREAAFFETFRELYVKTCPRIAAVQTEIGEQALTRALQTSVIQVAGFSATRFQVHSGLADLAARLRARRVTAADYQNWFRALVATVRQHDPQFHPAIGIAWQVVLAPGVAFMQLDPVAEPDLPLPVAGRHPDSGELG